MSTHKKPLQVVQASTALAYSVEGAAKAISLSKTTIWRLIEANELPTFKLGGRRLIRADALQAFIDRRSAA